MRGLVVFALVTANAATAFAQPGADPAQPAPPPADPAQPAPTAEPLRPAQPPPTPAEPLHPPLCVVRGENCRTVLLLETTWGLKPIVTRKPSGNETGANIAFEGGLLINAANHQGFGGSFGLRYVSQAEAAPFVFRGRYRHWLSPRTNVDVAPGFLLANVNRGGTGGTLQLAFERSGKIAFVLDVDVYRSSFYDDRTVTVLEVGFGVKFCGFVSIPATLLTLLIASFGRGTG